jgi:O-methyltransferase involved in polyketide biosynthesis
MARADSDRWDLATSVGATATMVAAQRALSNDEKLIDDPYAAPLVRAVGIDVYVRLVNGEIPVGGDTEFDPRRMAEGMACRTRFYDQFFLSAAQSGVAQAVILASGLDARAYRLPWPAGTVVYEVDMPAVIEFKTLTLRELGAVPTAEWRTVAIDLRDDWATALQAAGFDPKAPRRGAPRACWCTCRMRLRTRCSTTSPSSAPRAASWLSNSCPTQRFSRTHGGVHTTTG